jgi:SSS family solute:Na+ symporter
MTGIDLIILILFLASLFFFGSIFFKWIERPDDFFVAGRLLPPFILAAALTATNVNLYSFIGQAGKAYEQGISIVWHTWTGNMALVLAGLFVLPILRRLEIRTIPEFLEIRYGRPMRLLIAFLWILRLSFWLGIVLYTGATAAVVITRSGEETYLLWALIFSVITIIYTTAGGMWSVALTDTLQFSLMLLGALVFFPIIMTTAGGLKGIARTLPPEHLELVPQSGQLNWAFILAIFLLGLQWACTDQGMLQRAFSGRDVRTVARGLVLSGIQTTPFALLWYLPGLAARAIDPGIKVADAVIPEMLVRFVPTGIFGLILCGLLSAQMSTISSNINSAATLFTSDLYARLKRLPPSPRTTLVVARLITLVIGFLMIIFSLYARQLGAVNAYLLIIGIMDMPLFVVAIVYGLFWSRTTMAAAFAGYVSGAFMGALSVFYLFARHPNRTTIATFISAATALIVTPLITGLSRQGQQGQKQIAIKEAFKPSPEEIASGRAFHLFPRSKKGKTVVFIFFISLAVFITSIFLGGLGFSRAAAYLAVGSMIIYFASGLVRLNYD